MEGRACKSCRLIITHGDHCPLCNGTELTNKWSSYAIILNADKSEMAKKLNVKANSTFAMNIKE